MSHSESVCTLCWELLSSDSFFSSADSEKEDMAAGRPAPGLLRPRGRARRSLTDDKPPPPPPQDGRPTSHPASAGRRAASYGSPEGDAANRCARHRPRTPGGAGEMEVQRMRGRIAAGRQGATGGACVSRAPGTFLTTLRPQSAGGRFLSRCRARRPARHFRHAAAPLREQVGAPALRGRPGPGAREAAAGRCRDSPRRSPPSPPLSCCCRPAAGAPAWPSSTPPRRPSGPCAPPACS